MPSRTYTNIDFINYLAGFTANTGSNTATATPTSNYNFLLTASGANTADPPNGLEDSAIYVYEAEADLDFDVVPAIPEDALISRVEVKIDIEVSATASSSSTIVGPPSPCTAGGVFRGKVFLGIDELSNITFEEIQENIGASPQSASVNDFDHYTQTETFDFSGAPITKAALVAQFTTWLVQMEGIWSAGADITGPVAGTTAENSSFRFSGIRITITYEGGNGYSMVPTSGNVEVGQTLTVTGPHAAENTYAAISGDHVIPIVPKIVNDEEVILEVPYPPLDPCLDCFGDCPNCDDCVAACTESLDSEECQACLQECLDCLAECLEDLEQAEECQQSTQDSPGPTTIIIVMSGTRFHGSVTLGTLTVLVAQASGIYRFVMGKRNDTVYDSARNGESHDIKIPNPGAKTGFFRS